MCAVNISILLYSFSLFFFFNDTATTEIYTLSLHDALPIFAPAPWFETNSADGCMAGTAADLATYLRMLLNGGVGPQGRLLSDRKSTRLNSSHANISYAVFCLKKKKKKIIQTRSRSIKNHST